MEKAAALIEKMNQSFKGDSALPSVNAYHYLVIKKYDLAKKEGVKALGLNPYDFGSKGYLALVAVEEKDFKKAEKLAKEIEKINPANPMPPFIRAKIYMAQKKLIQAETEARKAIEKYPYDNGYLPHLSSYHALITALEAQSKTEEAKAAQEAMLKNRQE